METIDGYKIELFKKYYRIKNGKVVSFTNGYKTDIDTRTIYGNKKNAETELASINLLKNSEIIKKI